MTEDIDGCEVEKEKGKFISAVSKFQKEIVANPIVREGDQLDPDTQIVQLKPAPSKAIKHKLPPRELAVIRLPSLKPLLMIMCCMPMPTVFASGNQSGNARALVQRHGERDVWIKSTTNSLTTEEMDYVFDLPYARLPHPSMEMHVSQPLI